MGFNLSSNLTEDIQALPFGALTLNAQSGAGYTLVLTDAGKLVTLSNASAQNLTIPLNSSVAYATGTVIELLNISTGTWTIVPTGGVTLTGTTSVPTSARIRLTKTGTDTWYASAFGGGSEVLMVATTFATSSAVNVNNCFSSSYDNYRVLINFTTVSVNLTAQLRMRVGGADASGASTYGTTLLYNSYNASTPVGAADNFGSTAGSFASPDSGQQVYCDFTVFQPAIARKTTWLGASAFDTSVTTAVGLRSVIHNVATAYDGFSIIPTSGTISGSLRVYALANS